MRMIRKLAPWIVVLAMLGLPGFAVASYDVHVYRVDAGSMEPTIPQGSFVITTRPNTLDTLDIITFKNEKGKLTTHTFLGYASDGSLTTKGDANLTPDAHTPPLRKERVVGKAWRVLSPTLLWVMLGFAGLLFILWVIPTKKPNKNVVKSESSDDKSVITPV